MAGASLRRPLVLSTAAAIVFYLGGLQAHFASAAEPTASDQIAHEIHPGLRQLEVQSILFRLRPGAGWRDETQLDLQRSRSRYALPDGRYLLVGYGNVRRQTGTLGPDGVVTAVRLLQFNALLKETKAGDVAALCGIHRSPSINGNGFDPTALVVAVNALQPLGKAAALQALRSYDALCRGASDETKFDYDLDPQRLFLIARVLFEPVAPNQRPPLALGTPSPGEGADPRDWPEFPLALQDDVPFCLCSGYALGGEAEQPSQYLQDVEANQVLRQSPLKPEISPVLAMDRLKDSPRWRRLFTSQSESDFCTYLLRLQVMRTAIPITKSLPDDQFICGDCQGEEAATKNWNTFVDRHHLTEAAWSESGRCFVTRSDLPATQPAR